jgi:hypothetical protein
MPSHSIAAFRQEVTRDLLPTLSRLAEAEQGRIALEGEELSALRSAVVLRVIQVLNFAELLLGDMLNDLHRRAVASLYTLLEKNLDCLHIDRPVVPGILTNLRDESAWIIDPLPSASESGRRAL